MRFERAQAEWFAGDERADFDRVTDRTSFYRPEMLADFDPYFGRLLVSPPLAAAHHDLSMYLKAAVPPYEKFFAMVVVSNAASLALVKLLKPYERRVGSLIAFSATIGVTVEVSHHTPRLPT